MTQLLNHAEHRTQTPEATPDRLTAALDFAAELYEAPSVSAAAFLPREWTRDGYSQILLHTSQKSLSALNKRGATEIVTVDSDNAAIAQSGAVPTADDVKHSLLSPDGSRLALFRVTPGKDGKGQKRVIEVYTGRGERKVEELDVTKETGEFYFDATFGTPTWHHDNKHLAFVAEAPGPKGNDDPFARPAPDKFRYTPDYGETFTGKQEPTLFLVALSKSPVHDLLEPNSPSKSRPSIHRLTFPETGGVAVNFGQPVFVPSASSEPLKLLATGYSSLGDDRKLGIVYCANRPARIYELTLGQTTGENDESSLYGTIKVTPISPADRSARSPRVHVPPSSTSPAAKKSQSVSAVYISNRLGGVHSSCASLHLLTLDPSSQSWSAKDLVTTVSSTKTIDDFPGLYVDQLPAHQPFLSLESGVHVVLSSIWRSRRVPLIVSLENGKVTSLAPWPKANGDNELLPYLGKERALDSFGVFGTDGGKRILAVRSGTTKAPEVVVVDLTTLEKVEWKVVRGTALSDELENALSKLESTVLPLPKFLPSEIILVSPSSLDEALSKPPPLSLTGHGGPNSTTTTDWNVSTAAMALAGFRVAFCNYPGSLGFGQDFVDALAPQLGILEVDAVLATKHHLEQLGLSTKAKKRNVYIGGSHGGWCGSHLTSKYPDEFDACVMRNPVVDLPSMLASTDIPDWTYCEMDLDYSQSSPPSVFTPELFAKLHTASPLMRAANVTTPTLLLVGKNDRRVPPDQARQWYHALKKNVGRDGHPLQVEMLAFEGEGHPITNNVENEWVAFEEGFRFMASRVDFE
ncbi:hypothetical protein JCM11491_002972 [Sporobolomyces phaffii]